MFKHALAGLVLALVIVSAPARAGGWVSSGGELQRYYQNPWFLRHVDVVRYCVRVDPVMVSIGRDRAAELIAEAFRYWKRQFVAPNTWGGEGTNVATQDFIEVPCGATLDADLKSLDIVFQLGTLTQKQMSYFGDPRRYAAVTVLTDYDLKRLRGRGFVYFSGDQGELRYQRLGLVDHGWSAYDNNLFYHVAVHELGHIFGIQHEGEATYTELMGAGYAEYMLSRRPIIRIERFPPINYLEISGTSPIPMYCGQALPERYYALLELPRSAQCVKREIRDDRIVVRAYDSTGIEMVAERELIFKAGTRQVYPDRALVTLSLPEEQEVFPPRSSETINFGYLRGPSRMRVHAQAYLDAPSGRRIELSISVFNQVAMEIVGLVGDQMIRL